MLMYLFWNAIITPVSLLNSFTVPETTFYLVTSLSNVTYRPTDSGIHRILGTITITFMFLIQPLRQVVQGLLQEDFARTDFARDDHMSRRTDWHLKWASLRATPLLKKRVTEKRVRVKGHVVNIAYSSEQCVQLLQSKYNNLRCDIIL